MRKTRKTRFIVSNGHQRVEVEAVNAIEAHKKSGIRTSFQRCDVAPVSQQVLEAKTGLVIGVRRSPVNTAIDVLRSPFRNAG